MLLNTPKPEDFFDIGTELLHDSFDFLFQAIDLRLWGVKDSNSEYRESTDERTNSSFRRKIGLALNTLQQSIEILLKGKVVTISPYLILRDQSIYNSTKKFDMEFDDLITIDAKDLINAINNLYEHPVPDNLRVLFDRHRKTRNKITHSPAKGVILEAYDVFEYACAIIHYFFNGISWLDFRWKMHMVECGDEHKNGKYVTRPIAYEYSLFSESVKGKKHEDWMLHNPGEMIGSCMSCCAYISDYVEEPLTIMKDDDCCFICDGVNED